MREMCSNGQMLTPVESYYKLEETYITFIAILCSWDDRFFRVVVKLLEMIEKASIAVMIVADTARAGLN